MYYGDQIPEKRNFRKGEFIVVQSSIMGEKAWQQEREASGHIVSTVMKQRDECWSLAIFSFVQGSNLCNDDTCIQASLPSSVNLVQKLLYKHAPILLYLELLELNESCDSIPRRNCYFPKKARGTWGLHYKHPLGCWMWYGCCWVGTRAHRQQHF